LIIIVVTQRSISRKNRKEVDWPQDKNVGHEAPGPVEAFSGDDRVTRGRFIESFGGCLPGSHNPNQPHISLLESKSFSTKPPGNRRDNRKAVAIKSNRHTAPGMAAGLSPGLLVNYLIFPKT
jgi:hypothetical protein